jgi:uncharacterized protein involved in exopolysaccharide biosynthesis
VKADDISVTVRAIDKASPVLRRISRQLWWFQYGGAVLFATVGLLMVLVMALAFALGRVTA